MQQFEYLGTRDQGMDEVVKRGSASGVKVSRVDMFRSLE